VNVDVQLICQCWIQAGFMNIFIKYGCYTFFVKDSRSTEVNNVASSPAGPNLCFSNLTSFLEITSNQACPDVDGLTRLTPSSTETNWATHDFWVCEDALAQNSLTRHFFRR